MSAAGRAAHDPSFFILHRAPVPAPMKAQLLALSISASSVSGCAATSSQLHQRMSTLDNMATSEQFVIRTPLPDPQRHRANEIVKASMPTALPSRSSANLDSGASAHLSPQATGHGQTRRMLLYVQSGRSLLEEAAALTARGRHRRAEHKLDRAEVDLCFAMLLAHQHASDSRRNDEAQLSLPQLCTAAP